MGYIFRIREFRVGFVAGAVLTVLVYLIFQTPAVAKPIYAEERMAACIERLAEYRNSLPPGIYGESVYRYDPEYDRCLYRGNFVETDENYYFEKFIVDVFTGETLARYAERDGRPVIGTLDAFTEALDRLFSE